MGNFPYIGMPCRGVSYIVRYRNIKIIILPFLLLLGGVTQPASAKDVLVFAAASTMEAITSAALKFSQLNDIRVRSVFASSAVLAKQIHNGAPADIYLSANPMWMDYLSDHGWIILNSRNDLLSNRLVVIVPSNGTFKALESVNVWDITQKFLVRTMDAKMALRLVIREEVPLGIVYASDARATNKVRIVDTIPISSHEPIRYPIALISTSETPIARSFLEFLFTPEIRELFYEHGFSSP